MKRLLIFVLLIASGAAQAQWTYVDMTESAGYFVDLSTRKQTSTRNFRIWEMANQIEPRPSKSGVYKSKMSLKEFECDNGLFRILQLQEYSDEMGKGKVVFSDNSVSPWVHIAPGSIAEALKDYACSSTVFNNK